MKTPVMRMLAMATLLAAGLGAGTGAYAGPRTVTAPDAPRALEVQGPVQVNWTDPSQFTEIRSSHNRWESERGNWVEGLATHLRKRAEQQLAPGQTLEVKFTDIKRAGDYEPWHGPRLTDVRVMRDIYPPRITLQYTLKAADGSVLAEGERKLSDTGYLMNTGPASNTDPLRYEKQMLDDWLRRDLKPAGYASAQGR